MTSVVDAPLNPNKQTNKRLVHGDELKGKAASVNVLIYAVTVRLREVQDDTCRFVRLDASAKGIAAEWSDWRGWEGACGVAVGDLAGKSSGQLSGVVWSRQVIRPVGADRRARVADVSPVDEAIHHHVEEDGVGLEEANWRRWCDEMGV